MIAAYAEKTGAPYPYEKYSQVAVQDFIFGGMENTSATTQTEYTLHPESLEQEYSSEYLVAHELAHQWFGDLVTCKGWHHAWLNEGFATYSEGLWTEFEHGTDEFLYELYGKEKAINELGSENGENKGTGEDAIKRSEYNIFYFFEENEEMFKTAQCKIDTSKLYHMFFDGASKFNPGPVIFLILAF